MWRARKNFQAAKMLSNAKTIILNKNTSYRQNNERRYWSRFSQTFDKDQKHIVGSKIINLIDTK